MPRPTWNDPDRCAGEAYEERHGWLYCTRCDRVLKARGAHRVRSRTTASLDKLRDGLLAAGIRP